MIAYNFANIYKRAGNEAVDINPPDGLDLHLTTHGSNWLWAVFSIFSLAAILVFAHSLFMHKSKRLFHHFAIFGYLVFAIQYFTLASDLGWTGTQAEFNHVTSSTQTVTPGIRQFFYARWVGYFVAFPSFFISYATLVGLSWSEALFAISALEITVISLLIGPLIPSTYKWGYFTFGVVSLLVVCYCLLFNYRTAAYDNDLFVSRRSIVISAGATFLLLLYPICWGLTDGGNVIQTDSEAVFYGILDLAFFIILNGYLLFISRQIHFEDRGIAGFQNKVFSNTPLVPIAPLAPTEKTNATPTEPTPSTNNNLQSNNNEPLVSPI